MQGNQRQTLLAYAAGILDADGCFMISKHKRKTKTNRKYSNVEKLSPTYMPTVKVAMVESEAIDLLIHELGYGKHNLEGARKSRPNNKPIYHWYLRGAKKVLPFLEEVTPYLRVKTKRSNFLKKYCERMVNVKNVGFRGLTDHELDYREDSYIKMRELNGNKVAATTKSSRPERVSDSLIS